MRITNLEIHNFRGIKNGNVSFPNNSRIACIIGAGDSTKSTLLKAIEWAFWPSWNLIVNDTDFYHEDTSNSIIVRCSFSAFPSKLMAEDKFGLYLRNPNTEIAEGINDEPNDGTPYCLTIQLTVDSTLEPKWEIVCNRLEPKPISQTDRRTLPFGVVGEDCSKDMVWGKYSILQKYANAKGVLHEAYTAALRDVAEKADLSKLDDIATTLIDIGKKYGVGFENELRSKLLIQNGSFSSTVGLFDGNAPLSQMGTGSQRLISMGLNINVTDGGSLLLIDEIETGLEPYRIRSLINEFRTSHSASGQIIMTTHSPVVVAECSIDELLVAHSVEGETNAILLKCGDDNTNENTQRQIRFNSEAFLSKRLIVCEGKTEMGFIRAFDEFLYQKQAYRIAYKGIGTANGNGADIFNCAKVLTDAGYDICILMDSDLEAEETEKSTVRSRGISVFDWKKPLAFEEQVFSEISIDEINQAVEIAVEEKGRDSIRANLSSCSIPFEIIGDDIVLRDITSEQKVQLGALAKKKSWFKNIGLGQQIGDIVFSAFDSFGADSRIRSVIKDLTTWVMKDDTRRTVEDTETE